MMVLRSICPPQPGNDTSRGLLHTRFWRLTSLHLLTRVCQRYTVCQQPNGVPEAIPEFNKPPHEEPPRPPTPTQYTATHEEQHEEHSHPPENAAPVTTRHPLERAYKSGGDNAPNIGEGRDECAQSCTVANSSASTLALLQASRLYC
ncbi:uncharacterized protein SCHCODRAFT_02629882 [Schizophyllum commune H4-8]|uniref:uncharacterized protein n=1 Tax=Schizophyllum commune (strain H4-8 / FGSC 9210) TaxID=578458 RepID=UPI00215FE4F7|nr:uncharacterized protein SCHCODRAFT_02629882 [Schizophyllum commune H4-8]KAI5891721.1 hypothetical protein SCHCODRAFT_02629882 [Schizophyllum commune H4-8]